MIRKTNFLLLVISAILLLSCSKSEVNDDITHPGLVNFSLSAVECSDDAKTYLGQDGRTVLWGTGEFLQLYYNDGTAKFAKSESSSAGKYDGKDKATFDFSLSSLSATSYSLGGIYPASSVINVGGVVNNNPAAYKIGLKSPQISKDGNYDPEAFVMVMQPSTVPTLSGTVEGAFRRAVALNNFTLVGVKEKVKAVEIIAPGYSLGGKREIDLTTGESGNVYEPSESITVQFATQQNAGTVDVWFSSWGITVEQTEEMAIRVVGTENTYTKFIQVGSGGLTLAEGKINKLKLDFSAVEPDMITLADFAISFAGILSVWESTVGKVSIATGDAPKVYNDVQYLPADLKINVGNLSLNKANMFDVALQGFVALKNGGSLSDKMPAPHSYSWGDNPYNELPGNGGDFANYTVDMDFLSNFCTRQSNYAKNNSIWANMVGYAADQLAGYGGACCLERGLLMLARFYEYILDKDITSDIAAKCSSMALNAGLYEEATPPSATINDFAKAYVKILSTWESKTSTSGKVGTVTINGHYVPASTKVTVNAKSYNKAQTYDIALKAMYLLLDGKSNLSTAMPEPSSIAKWGDDPYLENPEFTTSTVTLDFLQNYASRQQNYLKTNKVWANFCIYGTGGATSSGTPTVSGFKGNCSLERSYLIMARFFKYILDKKISSNFATALASVKFDADLYGDSPTPPPAPTDQYLKGGTYCDISSTTVKNAVAAAYKYYGTTASASASTRAKAIYKYALDKWNYKWYQNTSLGSNKMITSQLGNCCDMSHGIVAMCRCAGIRARYYHAQVYYKSSGRTGHVMAQIDMNNNADNPNWKIADATNNSNTSIGTYTWTDPRDVKTYAILPF